MAGFAGHAVFPTVYRDMENPKMYTTMVNWTYLATTIVYFGVAACGYLMFGSDTMQEVTYIINYTCIYIFFLNCMYNLDYSKYHFNSRIQSNFKSFSSMVNCS